MCKACEGRGVQARGGKYVMCPVCKKGNKVLIGRKQLTVLSEYNKVHGVW
jgi:translation initiation factor 2 beta subunit (eIF-2beta)/eIF-5